MKLSVLFVIAGLLILGSCAYALTGLPIDPRLDQKVTLDGGYQRLHSVCGELTARTGVRIDCGRNAADWQVRDIPMTLCVRDMRLWDVLNLIADTAHLDLKVAQENGEITYRLWRGGKRGAELEKHLSALNRAIMDRRTWEWDVLSRLNRLPNETLEKKPDGTPADRTLVSYARNMSKVLSALGNSTRTKVMGGKVVRVTLADIPSGYRSALTGLFLDAYKRDPDIGGVPRSEEQEKRLTECGLVILRQEGRNADICLRPRLDRWGISEPIYDTTSGLVDALLTGGTLEASGLPKQPALPSTPKPDFHDPELKPMSADMPILAEKVTLKRPRDGSLTASDALVALSKAGGYTIICEDFLSHRLSQPAVDDLFAKETTAGDVLKKLQSTAEVPAPSTADNYYDKYALRSGTPNLRGRFNWYINEKQKQIVGRAADWPVQHRDLAPEETIAFLTNKLNTDGVDLDEYLLYAYTDPDQREQWMKDSRELSRISARVLDHLTEIWRFYASLKPEQKTQARSANGLRLDFMGIGAVQDLLSRDWESKRLYTWQYPDRSLEPEPVVDPRWRLVLKVISNSETPAFGLWISGDPDFAEQFNEMARKYAELPTHWYSLEVSYEYGGETKNLVQRSGPQWLPVYSEKRERELRSRNAVQ